MPNLSKIPVEKGTGNVYADLGYPDSAEMLVKAQLVTVSRSFGIAV